MFVKLMIVELPCPRSVTFVFMEIVPEILNVPAANCTTPPPAFEQFEIAVLIVDGEPL